MRAVLALEALEAIVEAFHRRDWHVIAPKIRGKAIVYDEIASAAELPIGWKDVQAPGSYRLERRDDEARFGFAVGPQSWKRELLAPDIQLLKIERSNGAFKAATPESESRRTVFLGAKPCEIAAIEIQDRVLIGGKFADQDYLSRRQRSFIVAVNCSSPAANCFCRSMGTGPAADHGYDILLTEILEGEHRFLAESGTEEGSSILAELPQREATDADAAAARAVTDAASEKMGITLKRERLREILQDNFEHPRYDEVARRCLACTNCTLACPTCFCTQVDDVNDLSPEAAARTRRWDSCFSLQYSEMHGGGTRRSTKARYRQWLTHKLSTWYDQFETIGCVGCGRCITWCPVGIDIREEVAAIRATQEAKS
jgi:sulfhydrogenase subunit beta (sulfur reductase)